MIVDWFEIPVYNLDRAVMFYRTVFDYDIVPQTSDEALIHDAHGKAVGVLRKVNIYGLEAHPSANGTRLYLRCAQPLALMLRQVKAAGGLVLVRQRHYPRGCGALILDSEGNRIGLSVSAVIR